MKRDINQDNAQEPRKTDDAFPKKVKRTPVMPSITATKEPNVDQPVHYQPKANVARQKQIEIIEIPDEADLSEQDTRPFVMQNEGTENVAVQYSSADGNSQTEVEEVIDNNTEQLSWIDRHDILFRSDDRDKQKRFLSPKIRCWRGAEWTSLLVIEKGSLGVFLGYEDMSKLPDNFRCKISFTYTLLDKDDNCIAVGQHHIHILLLLF